jgi:ATP-dependent DNA ligase
MLYKPCIAIPEIPKVGKVLVEPKFDGMFASIRKINNQIEVWSRRGERKPTLEQMLKDSLEQFPADIYLLGEAEYGSQAGRIATEKRGYSVIHCFDMVESDEDKEDLVNRKQRLFKFLKSLGDKHLVPVEDKIARVSKVPEIFKQYIKQGFEGIVVKELDKDFKSESWWKQKKVLTDEFILIDYEYGDAIPGIINRLKVPRKRMVKGIVCGLWKDNKFEKVMRVGISRFDVILELTLNPKKYLGKVVEIKGFERFQSGALRHASFVRFRNDLSARDLRKILTGKEVI